MIKLLKALRSCRSLERIILYGNLMDEKSVKYLGKLIKLNKHVTFVDLGGCNISDDMISILKPYLLSNRSLERLRLSETIITDFSVPDLIMIIENSNIIYLDVYQTTIENKGRLVPSIVENIIRLKKSFIDSFES